MDTRKRLEFYTPRSMALWCRTVDPDKYGRHTMTVLYGHKYWADLRKEIETWAEEECGVECFDFEEWCLRPVSTYAVEEFEGVNEYDSCMQFNSKLYAAKGKKFPVYGPDNTLRDHEVLSGSDVIIKGVCKFWSFTDEETGEHRQGMSLYMEDVKFFDITDKEV